MMKVFLYFPMALLLSLVTAQAEQDVWYNASGKVVGTTPVEKQKEAFVPDWKKREIARLEAQRNGTFTRGFHRIRRGRSFGHSGFFFSRFRGGFRSFNRGGFRSSRGFRGSFRGNRFSVRSRF